MFSYINYFLAVYNTNFALMCLDIYYSSCGCLIKPAVAAYIAAEIYAVEENGPYDLMNFETSNVFIYRAIAVWDSSVKLPTNKIFFK